MALPIPAPAPELSAALCKLLRLAHEVLPFDEGAIYRLIGEELRPCALWALPGLAIEGGIEGRGLSLEEGLCARAARQQGPLLLPVVEEESFPQPTRKRNVSCLTRSFLALPLTTETEIIGVLALHSRTPRFFKPTHIELVRLVADQAALVLRNDRLLQREQEAQRMSALLHRMARQLSGARTLEQVIEIVLDRLRELLPFDSASIALLEGEVLEFVGGRGREAPRPGERLPLSRLVLPGQVIQAAAPLVITGAPVDSSGRDGRRGHRSWLGVPLIVGGDVIGLLACAQACPLGYGEREKQIAMALADQATIAIENARLLQVARLRQAELERVTVYNDLLIESSPIGIAVIAPDGRFVHANPAFAAVVGQPVDRIAGMTLEELLPGVGSGSLPGMARETLADGIPRQDKNFYCSSLPHGPLWLDISFNPLRRTEGEVTGIMMTLTDITNRKRLEEDLRHRNDQVNQTLERHRALYEIGTRINAELNVQKLLEILIGSVQMIFAADGLTLLMPDEQGRHFQFVTALGLSDQYLAAEQALYDRSAGGLAIAQLAPMLISDIAADARMGPLRENAWEEGIRTALFLPLVHREEVIALLSMYHRMPYRYTLEEMELLAIIAGQATTALKNAHLYNSIVQSRSNLSAILQSMTDGVMALDEQERVIFINQPLFDMLGIEPEGEWSGQTAKELWPPLAQLIARLAPEESQEDARQVTREEIELEQPPCIIEVVHTPICDETDRRIGRLILLHDITEVRAGERMKDELISMISHELRTPLTSILGYSKLLVDRPDSEPDRRLRWANHVLNKSRLLNQLVNEVLDLSRMNMRRFSLNVQPTDLRGLINRIVDEQSLTTDDHVIEVELFGPLENVPVDPARIDQLITNLIINAIKYSPDGGTITVRAERMAEELRLSVRDEGMGVAPEHQARIFEPFFRVDTSTTRVVYGTGLGLSLCRGIARAHGGDITLESVSGRGTVFHVRLPLPPRGNR